jgi:hypothetical protein
MPGSVLSLGQSPGRGRAKPLRVTVRMHEGVSNLYSLSRRRPLVSFMLPKNKHFELKLKTLRVARRRLSGIVAKGGHSCGQKAFLTELGLIKPPAAPRSAFVGT